MSNLFSRFIYNCIIALFLFTTFLFLDQKTVLGATSDVHLTTTIVDTTAISLFIAPNSLDFGSFIPGTEVRGGSGLDLDVTTNSALGYTLGVNDSVAGNDSALLHTDGIKRIPDFSSPISNPTVWNSGVSKGLGLTVYGANTTKEAKWGAGNAYNDINNAYAGVPELLQEIHNVGGPMNGSDHTFVGLILDAPTGQKPGDYSGDITFTATANFL
jgi:hypothetical protein